MPPDAPPFSIVEDEPFLAALNTAILVRRQVQDVVSDLHRLDEFERAFICVDTFLTEAHAGGIGHFFENDCAVLYAQVLLGLTEIGAQRLRLQLEHYVARVFGRELPSSAESRRVALHALSVDEDDEAERIVEALPSGASLLAAWARAHQQHLTPQ